MDSYKYLKMKYLHHSISVLMLCVPILLLGQDRTNVLFIMSDDLNNHIGAYGDSLVKTPNLDRLAKEGILFEKSYCQYPLCGPSRASLMTGIRPDELGMVTNENHIRDQIEDLVTLPQLFKENGYFTARAGKIYHYNVPAGIGTDGADDPVSWNETRNPSGRDKEIEDEVTIFGSNKNLGTAFAIYNDTLDNDLTHTDGMVATEVIAMMKEHKDEPFFIGAGFFRPHCPYVAPKKYFDLYDLDAIDIAQIPEYYVGTVPELALMALKGPKDTIEQKRVIQAYLASISYMDACVGRLLDALDSLGLAENTIVVFASDHGYNLGEHTLWQKMNLFETATRAPLLIRIPKGPSGKVKQLVEMLDVYPTIAELCNLKVPEAVEGSSMVELMEGKDKNWKNQAVSVVARRLYSNEKKNHGYTFAGKTIRTPNYRYTEWMEGSAGIELYDLKKDPMEMNNLARSKAYQKHIKRLKKRLRQ